MPVIMCSSGALPRGAGLSFLRRAGSIRPRPLSSPHQAARALHWSSKRLVGADDVSQSSSSSSSSSSSRSSRGPKQVEHGGGGGGIFGCLPARTALGRVGRGVLVALPLVGAGFAADLARKDYRRARLELRHVRLRLALAEVSRRRRESTAAGAGAGEEEDGAAALPDQPVVDLSPARAFGVAAAVDSGVALAHLVSLYGLYQGWEPEPIINAGIAVAAGAVLSAGGGVRGEYLVARRELAERRAKSTENPEDGGGVRGGAAAAAAAAEEVRNE